MTKKNISVLIVDDNIHFVRRMIAMIKESNETCTIHAAYDHDEGFGMLDKKPDLALLDISLPGKNGLDLLKKIKDSTGDCEVIMLTNTTGEYYSERCRKLGALHFLDKTNDFELVPSLIKEFANQKNYKNLSCFFESEATNN